MTAAVRVATSLFAPPLRSLTIGLVLVVVATAFEALAVATILPETAAELGGLALYGWTFSAFMLANLIGITLGGTETDRTGPIRPFVVGTILFVGGLAASGLAPSMLVIVVGRTSQGLGAGLLSAVAYALIARLYPAPLQPRMLATLSSAWVVPGLVGPGIAGVIAEGAGWRWVFLGLAPMPILAAMLVVPALRSLPASRDGTLGHARTWASVRLALGAATALVGVGVRVASLATLLVAIGGVVAVRSFRTLMPKGTLRARVGLPAAVATMGLLNFAFFGTEAFLPLMLTTIRAQSVMVTGLALTAAALAWTTGAWLPVRLADRCARRAILTSGLAILAFGILATAAVLEPRVPALVAVIAWGVTGLGMGLAFTTASALILEAAPTGQEGETSASLQLAQVLGAAVATGLGGAIVVAPFARDARRIGVGVVDVVMLGAALLAIVSARRVGVTETDR